MKEKKIGINDLLFDTENYRLDDPNNQDDAFLQIMLGLREKVIRLANDMGQYGPNPSDLPIVLPFEQSGKYVVLEGNRRLAAIKLLTDPLFIDKITDLALKGKALAVRHDHPKFKITALVCLVATDRKEADHWIELRHTGQNQGVGIVPWNALATSKFSQHLGKMTWTTNATKLIDALNKSDCLSSSTKTLLQDVKLTNLGRLLLEDSVKKAINFEIKDGNVAVDLSKPEAIANVEKIITSLANPKFSVKEIYHKTDRFKYIESLGLAPSATTSTPPDNSMPGATPPRGAKTNSTQPPTAPETSTQPTPYPLTVKRVTIIPSTTTLAIPNPRINTIYTELKSLDVNKYTNCGAVMFRVFLEMSLDEYWAGIKPPGFGGEYLHKKITQISNHMEQAKILNQDELKGIRVAADPNNMHSPFSTNTLNAYVHNKDMAPIANDLKTSWDNIEKFVAKLWP